MAVVVTVRGTMKAADADAAQAAHDEVFARLNPIGKALGSISHTAHINPENPREFLALDRWPDVESLGQFMQDPIDPAAQIASLFEGEPDIVVWMEAGWAGS